MATPNTPIHIRVDDVERFDSQLKAFGFHETDESGISILPCNVNSYAAKNAEPSYTVDKSLPKEEYTQVVYWTRYEWAGNGNLNPVTDFTYIAKQRYHRDYFEPYSVCFTLVKDGGKTYIVSDPIQYNEDNLAKLLNTVNMLLGLFGECYLDFEQETKSTERVIVNWDILPPGEHPWASVKETLGKLTKGQTKTRQELMFRNCEAIYAKKPDFVAYGRAGFRGYAVFGFRDKNLFVLESATPNNATYVLQNDWESISQLTKAQILFNNLHTARIIHSDTWQKNFDKLMEVENE